MKGQSPEQNYERIKKVYEALGREVPDESRTVLQGVKIIIELNHKGMLECSICEDLMPIHEFDVDAQ